MSSTKTRHIRLKEWGCNAICGFIPSKHYLSITDGTLPEKEYILTTNSQGFIVDKIINDSLKKIYFLGDSFVESLYIDSNKRFPAQIQTMFNQINPNRVQCLNGGYSGATMLHILNLIVNNVEHNSTLVLVVPSSDINVLLEQATYWCLHNQTYTPIIPTNEFAMDKKDKIDFHDFENLLGLTINFCKAFNINLIISTIPFRNEKFKDNEYLHKTYKSCISYFAIVQKYKLLNHSTKNVANKYGVPILDLEILLAGSNNYFYDILHLNDKGSFKLSNIMFDFLSKHI